MVKRLAQFVPVKVVFKYLFILLLAIVLLSIRMAVQLPVTAIMLLLRGRTWPTPSMEACPLPRLCRWSVVSILLNRWLQAINSRLWSPPLTQLQPPQAGLQLVKTVGLVFPGQCIVVTLLALHRVRCKPSLSL